MAISLADQYYIKALDHFPYDLEESLENLNYALSYNEEHAGASCLMARLYADYLKEYGKAEAYFQAALACDPAHAESCQHYASLLLQLGQYSKARKLLKYAFNLNGAYKAVLLQLEALLEEHLKNYASAKLLLKEALLETVEEEQMNQLEQALKRVEKKEQMLARFVYL